MWLYIRKIDQGKLATFEGEIGDLRLKVQGFWGFGVLGSSFLIKIVKNDKKSKKRIKN